MGERCFQYSAAALHYTKRERAAEAASKLEKYATQPQKPPTIPLGPRGQRGAINDKSPEAGSDLLPAIQPLRQEAQTTHSSADMDDGFLQEERGSQHVALLPDPEPSIGDVFAAITSYNSTITTLNAHMDNLKTDMSLLRQDMRQFDERLKAAEVRISSMEDHIPALS